MSCVTALSLMFQHLFQGCQSCVTALSLMFQHLFQGCQSSCVTALSLMFQHLFQGCYSCVTALSLMFQHLFPDVPTSVPGVTYVSAVSRTAPVYGATNWLTRGTTYSTHVTSVGLSSELYTGG